jgi:hypothetical protein
MMLPEGVKKVDKYQHAVNEETSTTEIPIVEETLSVEEHSTKSKLDHVISDVEYDEQEYDNFIEMESYAQTKSNSDSIKDYLPLRDFSIDRWNHSPGLEKWGFNETSKE